MAECESKNLASTFVSFSFFVTVGKEQHGFIDLEMLPPELGITILSYLNATDLCLAGCVWQDLGNDEYLWQGYEGSPLVSDIFFVVKLIL